MLITTSLSLSLQLCGNVITMVFCGNYSVVKLACSDTSVNNIYGLTVTFFTVFVPLILIFYTYVKILKVCFCGSKQMRHNAVSTCTPHLVSLLNFFFACFFQILLSRFDVKTAPNVLNIVISLYYLTCQPLINPIIYGLKMSKILAICKRMFC